MSSEDNTAFSFKTKQHNLLVDCTDQYRTRTFIKYWYFFSGRYLLACLILALSRETPNKPK
jgi:hypothetical protein